MTAQLFHLSQGFNESHTCAERTVTTRLHIKDCNWNQTTTNKLPERRIDLQTKWEGLGSYGNVCPLPSIMPM